MLQALMSPVALLVGSWLLLVLALTGLLFTWSDWLWARLSEVEVPAALAATFTSLVRALLVADLAAARALLSSDPKDTGADALHLEWSFWLAVAGALVWEVAAGRAKIRKEKGATRSKFLASVLAYLDAADSTKRQRIENHMPGPGVQRTINHARAGLGPTQQEIWLMDSLAAFFATQARETDFANVAKNFRVALFVLDPATGQLSAPYSYSLRWGQRQCLQSPGLHQQRYNINNVNDPTIVVQCLQQQRPLIVNDGRRNQYPWFYFHPTQAQRYRSLIAYPIPRVIGNVVSYRSALVVDTEIPNFFRERDRADLETFLRQVVLRLELEDDIADLLG